MNQIEFDNNFLLNQKCINEMQRNVLEFGLTNAEVFE